VVDRLMVWSVVVTLKVVVLEKIVDESNNDDVVVVDCAKDESMGIIARMPTKKLIAVRRIQCTAPTLTSTNAVDLLLDLLRSVFASPGAV